MPSHLECKISDLTGQEFLELCREVGLIKRIPTVDLRTDTVQRPVSDRIGEVSGALDVYLEAQGYPVECHEVAKALGTSQPVLNRIHKTQPGKARAYSRNGTWFWWIPVA